MTKVSIFIILYTSFVQFQINSGELVESVAKDSQKRIKFWLITDKFRRPLSLKR